ncbi:unnamed protein product [Arabidopsis thaliana]|nr:unnamed protein product [Arabidopsis thaliana]VYS61198.1 unnamed protein product [Arabidopsis thaliana]
MVIKMSILMILISSMVMNMVEVEVDQIESWVKDFQDGKAAVHKNSQPIPAENNEPVKLVVAESLDDIVQVSERKRCSIRRRQDKGRLHSSGLVILAEDDEEEHEKMD